MSRSGVRVSGGIRESWGSQGRSRGLGSEQGALRFPGDEFWVSGPGKGSSGSQDWGTGVPRGGAGIQHPERPPSHARLFLSLHARPLREPLSTPRDRKWPPVGAGGAGPGGGTSGAHAPPPRSSGAVTLCSAGRAGPARPRRSAAARPARRARGEWVAGADGRARSRVGPPLHAGAGGRGEAAGPAGPGLGLTGPEQRSGWAFGGRANARRGPRTPVPDRAMGAGSDPRGGRRPAARSRRAREDTRESSGGARRRRLGPRGGGWAVAAPGDTPIQEGLVTATASAGDPSPISPLEGWKWLGWAPRELA